MEEGIQNQFWGRRDVFGRGVGGCLGGISGEGFICVLLLLIMIWKRFIKKMELKQDRGFVRKDII